MMTCQQCGRPAFYQIDGENGIFGLCIECNLKREQASALELQCTMQLLNTTLAMFSMQSGIPLPKLPVTSVPIIPITNMNTSNVRVDNSAIGVLNLGYINSVDRTVTSLKQKGSTEIADALAKLTQAIVDNSEPSNKHKNDILEILSAIGTESEKPADQRRLAIVRSLTSELATLLGGLAGLSQLWELHGPTVRAYFGI